MAYKIETRLDLGRLATFVPNKRLPVYNWFYFKEGFARDLVMLILDRYLPLNSYPTSAKQSVSVLDPFVGSGTTLLACKERGLDSYGFDVSQPMVDALKSKPEAEQWKDLHSRISRQNLVDFRYDLKFDAVIIPARSFLHLTTQEEQIACLRTIHTHLVPSGKLLLNFFTPDPRHILARTDSNPAFEEFATFVHTETGKPVRLLFRQVNDLPNQLQRITWRFIYDGETRDSAMSVRWIHRSEFELRQY